MEKIDVAVQSYKKPESLIYTLLSLKKYCGNHIDTIYINDDCSGDDVISCYKDKEFLISKGAKHIAETTKDIEKILYLS